MLITYQSFILLIFLIIFQASSSYGNEAHTTPTSTSITTTKIKHTSTAHSHHHQKAKPSNHHHKHDDKIKKKRITKTICKTIRPTPTKSTIVDHSTTKIVTSKPTVKCTTKVILKKWTPHNNKEKDHHRSKEVKDDKHHHPQAKDNNKKDHSKNAKDDKQPKKDDKKPKKDDKKNHPAPKKKPTTTTTVKAKQTNKGLSKQDDQVVALSDTHEPKSTPTPEVTNSQYIPSDSESGQQNDDQSNHEPVYDPNSSSPNNNANTSPSNVNNDNVKNEDNFESSPVGNGGSTHQALGLGLGIGIGCVAAVGLAGLLVHNKRKHNESNEMNSHVDDPSASPHNSSSPVSRSNTIMNSNTKWRPQSFMGVLSAVVSKLPRSPSQRSQTSTVSHGTAIGSGNGAVELQRHPSDASSFMYQHQQHSPPPLMRVDEERQHYQY
ncbi:hypothetical protein BJ944DRAFT_291504 [Cunninghamella echinulata]|nr:hypothetical protein BJ944DRAFT_291504 [Cunninghamella echinulata]